MPHMMGKNETSVLFYPLCGEKIKLLGGVLERLLFKFELFVKGFYMKMLSSDDIHVCTC